MLKAVSGGGGKGMRVVQQADEFSSALQSAKREAQASFADDTMLIEKYLAKPRHIEIQVFADSHGNIVHLFERDCSIQRRHQKIIEEAPAPGITATLRQAMGDAAIAAAKAIDYLGAGTVEFLLDGKNKFYFMEMNTRLQVEHPVTEMITGQDLVVWQLRVAAGEKLPCQQKELSITGHAFEVRVYAENPNNDFLPSIGDIIHLQTPETNQQLRIDSGITQGDSISPYYDPMIAKLIVWGEDRDAALRQLQQALAAYQIVGVQTNLTFLQAIAGHSAFQQAAVTTYFIEQHQQQLLPTGVKPSSQALLLATLYLLIGRKLSAQQTTNADSPWDNCDGWRVNAPNKQKFYFKTEEDFIQIDVHIDGDNTKMLLAGETYRVTGAVQKNKLAATIEGETLSATIVEWDGQLDIFYHDQHEQVVIHDPLAVSHHEEESASQLVAPMPGTVIDVITAAGAKVVRGERLLVIEAMKMEHTIHAPADGVVKQLHFNVGDQVSEGEELLVI